MERFAKVLNHSVQFGGITSTQRFRDEDFNAVLQAAVRRGHTYLPSNVRCFVTITLIVVQRINLGPGS